VARRALLLFERLVKLPWWLGLVIAAVAYTIFTVSVPRHLGQSAVLLGVRSAGALVAWLTAVVFTVISLFSLARMRLASRADAPPKDVAWVRALDWEACNELMGHCWRGRGFELAEFAGETVDDDLLLVQLRSRQRSLVRYRHWRALNVGADPVRDLFAAMKSRDASRAFLITSGQFSIEALEFAQDKPIELIDGAALADMLEEGRRRIAPEATPGSDSLSAPRRCA